MTIGEAKRSNKASFKAKKHENPCMNWPAHLPCTTQGGVGFDDHYWGLNPTNCDRDLRQRWRKARGSLWCYAGKEKQEMGASLHHSGSPTPSTLEEVVVDKGYSFIGGSICSRCFSFLGIPFVCSSISPLHGCWNRCDRHSQFAFVDPRDVFGEMCWMWVQLP